MDCLITDQLYRHRLWPCMCASVSAFLATPMKTPCGCRAAYHRRGTAAGPLDAVRELSISAPRRGSRNHGALWPWAVCEQTKTPRFTQTSELKRETQWISHRNKQRHSSLSSTTSHTVSVPAEALGQERHAHCPSLSPRASHSFTSTGNENTRQSLGNY